MATDDRMGRRDLPRPGEPLPRDPVPVPREPRRTPAEDRSLGDLFRELSRETQLLMRQEIALAKTEASQKASLAGRFIGYLVGGGLVAYAGFLAVVLCVVLLLGLIMADWLAALIGGLIFIGIGAAVAMKGLRGLKETNFSLERTAETLQEDKQWLKNEAKDVR